MTRQRVYGRSMKITRGGQVTIPKIIREALSLDEGDEVEFELDDGIVMMRPAERLSPADLVAIKEGLAAISRGETIRLEEFESGESEEVDR